MPALLPLAANDALLVLSLKELHVESHDVFDNDVFATDDARSTARQKKTVVTIV